MGNWTPRQSIGGQESSRLTHGSRDSGRGCAWQGKGFPLHWFNVQYCLAFLSSTSPSIIVYLIPTFYMVDVFQMFLESLIALRPPLTPLGDRGLLMLICFVSLPSGFKFLLEAKFLKNEIRKWRTGFNKRYSIPFQIPLLLILITWLPFSLFLQLVSFKPFNFFEGMWS